MRIKKHHKIIEPLQPDRVWALGQIAGGRDTHLEMSTTSEG